MSWSNQGIRCEGSFTPAVATAPSPVRDVGNDEGLGFGQAYQELVEDEHPIVVIAGGDIAELLIEKAGLGSSSQARDWLLKSFPVGDKTALQ